MKIELSAGQVSLIIDALSNLKLDAAELNSLAAADTYERASILIDHIEYQRHLSQKGD